LNILFDFTGIVWLTSGVEGIAWLTSETTEGNYIL